MPHAHLRRSLALGARVIAGGLLLVGCAPQHTTTSISIEVVDGVTGAPASNVDVLQRVPTGKFERGLQSNSTTDERGVVRMPAIAGVQKSDWWIGSGGPVYVARQPALVPPEFRRAATSASGDIYVAPMWPAMRLRIELPVGYRGPVVEWPIAADAPRSSGWMVPGSVAADADRIALARVDARGVVAYPDSFGGVPGFAFVPERGLVVGPVLGDGRAIMSIGATSQRGPDAPVGAEIVAWEFGYSDDHDGFVSPQGRIATARDPLVWFVGSEADLRAWVEAHRLQPVAPIDADPMRSLRRARHFTRASLFAAIDPPSAATAAPTWTTSADIAASRSAAASR
ncbi:MAG: hypothetical protein U0572_00215 [Phycisphaerales bacterium]